MYKMVTIVGLRISAKISIAIGLSLFLFACSQLFSQGHRFDKVQSTGAINNYLIGSGDVVEIQVWRNEALSKVDVVRPDGKLSLPIIGELKASGLTPLELRDKVIGELRKLGVTDEATVIIREVNSFIIYLVGEVQRPGQYRLTGNTTVVQAIAMAGGFKQFALRDKILLLRKVEKVYDEQRILIKYDDIISGRKENIWLRPGDTISVP
jgi:polysaccharide export outer membrane protein